jgi:hypothetical protein
MGDRKWTPEQIDEPVKSGWRIDAINRYTGGPPTRYEHPITGRSVGVDDLTGQVIQVGADGFIFGEGSGHKPGAVMRPPPESASPAQPSGLGGGGGGRAPDPFGPRTRLVPEQEEPSE